MKKFGWLKLFGFLYVLMQDLFVLCSLCCVIGVGLLGGYVGFVFIGVQFVVFVGIGLVEYLCQVCVYLCFGFVDGVVVIGIDVGLGLVIVVGLG